VPGARWLVLACASRVLACVWHVLARAGAWEEVPELPPARGGSGETVLHAILQIG
jgi:hypothetical protein